ncbi:hypothetical protein IFM89_031986 [Coptis chinensis]|uniref:EF-hand domain-containing protein n=1 Tax=Coptis chinensis TaxID=261450 RepID=A0A835HGZ4_9MAGN|nr:hypothetical protein IFM89_031986 [Coptis chinensis]
MGRCMSCTRDCLQSRYLRMLSGSGWLKTMGGFKADADGNGTIDYDEFITTAMHMNITDGQERLYTIFQFQYFDKDNSRIMISLLTLSPVHLSLNCLNWDMMFVLGMSEAARIRVSIELEDAYPKVARFSAIVVNVD